MAVMTNKTKKYKTYNLHLKHIQIPEDARFDVQISAVLEQIVSMLELQNKLQKKMQVAHQFAVRSIIEGLYQVFDGI